VDGFVGAVSLNSGEFRHESLKRSKDPIKWILASSAMPIIFEPIEIENQKWTDGGVRSVTPVKELLSLKEYEFEHIDIIMADPPDINYTNSKFTSILDVAKRSLECSINEIMITDIETMGFKGTVSIYFPNSPLPFEAFSFKPEEMKLGIEIGYKETLEKLNK
jgi:predicted patatin/cPLA2 family phospholipase